MVIDKVPPDLIKMPDAWTSSTRTTQTRVSWCSGCINARLLRLARRQARALSSFHGSNADVAAVKGPRLTPRAHWSDSTEINASFSRESGLFLKDSRAEETPPALSVCLRRCRTSSLEGYAAQRDVWLTGPACCLCAAEQDGVSVEAWRAGTTANFTAAQRVTVAWHVHPEVRPASILYCRCREPRYWHTQQTSGG